MRQKFNIMKFVKHLCSFSPRLGVNEQKAADYLEDVLTKHNVSFTTQRFKSAVPIYRKALLYADKRKIECKGSCLVSGKIKGQDNLVSSFTNLDESRTKYNINFSPYCKGISVPDFYRHPAVTIKPSDIQKIVNAKKVHGEVKVKRFDYSSRNILVGNHINPKYLAFAHYDCIGKGGAIDNAAAVASLMYLILNQPKVLEKALFVFAGAEEVSYDRRPKYSGRGFRIFENKYKKLLKKAKSIFILDGIGHAKPYWIRDYDFFWITFQVRMLKAIQKKIYAMHADDDTILKVYHSDLDTINNMKKKYVIEAAKFLLKKM
jgi:hypothetical protein